MDAFETTLGSLIAVVLVVMALYFAWRQRVTLRTLRSDPHLSREHRRYLFKQTSRRLFGSVLMLLLAGLLVGSLFLDYEPVKEGAKDFPAIDKEAARQATRLVVIYWMTLLLVLMVIMALAVFDLWATARFGVHLRKQLAQEHQDALEAELARLRQRRAEMN